MRFVHGIQAQSRIRELRFFAWFSCSSSAVIFGPLGILGLIPEQRPLARSFSLIVNVKIWLFPSFSQDPLTLPCPAFIFLAPLSSPFFISPNHRVTWCFVLTAAVTCKKKAGKKEIRSWTFRSGLFTTWSHMYVSTAWILNGNYNSLSQTS